MQIKQAMECYGIWHIGDVGKKKSDLGDKFKNGACFLEGILPCRGERKTLGMTPGHVASRAGNQRDTQSPFVKKACGERSLNSARCKSGEAVLREYTKQRRGEI